MGDVSVVNYPLTAEVRRRSHDLRGRCTCAPSLGLCVLAVKANFRINVYVCLNIVLNANINGKPYSKKKLV